MSDTLSHEALRDMVPAAALEALDGAERELVARHLGGCRECGSLFEEYRRVTGALELMLPLRAMDPARSEAVRSRLLARVREEQSRRGRPRGGRAAALAGRWAGWAVAAGLAGVVLVHHAIHRPLDHGWLVAGLLLLALVAVGWYAVAMRGRAARLQQRLQRMQDRLGSNDGESGTYR